MPKGLVDKKIEGTLRDAPHPNDQKLGNTCSKSPRWKCICANNHQAHGRNVLSLPVPLTPMPTSLFLQPLPHHQTCNTRHYESTSPLRKGLHLSIRITRSLCVCRAPCNSIGQIPSLSYLRAKMHGQATAGACTACLSQAYGHFHKRG